MHVTFGINLEIVLDLKSNFIMNDFTINLFRMSGLICGATSQT